MSNNAPPLGVMPEWLWLENRIADLYDAAERYKEAGKNPKYFLDQAEGLAIDYKLSYPERCGKDSNASGKVIARAIAEHRRNQETHVKAPEIAFEVRSFDGTECRESRTVATFARYADAWEVAQREKCYDAEVMGSVHPIFITERTKLWFSLEDYDKDVQSRSASYRASLMLTREQENWLKFNERRKAIGWSEVSFEEYREEMKRRPLGERWD